MKLFYLGRSQANAALACGLRLDGTDKIENFEESTLEIFTPADYYLILRKSNVLAQSPLFKKMCFDSVSPEGVNDIDFETEFALLFPEFIGPSLKPFTDYLDTHKVAVTCNGDIILYDCCEDTGSSYLERIFKALCDHLGVHAALCTPIWHAIKNR